MLMKKKAAVKKLPDVSWTFDELREVLKAAKVDFPLSRWDFKYDRASYWEAQFPVWGQIEMTHCCAYDIAHGLFVPNWKPGWNEATYRAAILYTIKSYDSAPYLLFFTTNHQKPVVELFESLGFERLGSAIRNPNSGNTVQIWRVETLRPWAGEADDCDEDEDE